MRRLLPSPFVNALSVLSLVAGLGACVTAQQLDDRLAVWVGQDADALATAWGAPNGTYQKKDGSRILPYDRSSVVSTGPQFALSTTTRRCRIDFTTDADGKITSAKWDGAPDECDRSIP
jgi:hypothetical protein